MTKEEHDNILSEIRTTDNAGRRSELLQQLDNDYTTMLANETEHNETITRLTTENKTLAQANNSLWLERTNVNNVNNNVNNNGDNQNDEPPKKIDIDKLDFE